MVQEGFTFPTHIPLEQLLAPCKKTRGKKGRITRPQNAFILYRKDLQDKIKNENPQADFKEISKIAGNRWKNEADQVKNNYTLLATLGGLVHQDLFPNYKYQPRQ
ncbi:high mobility group box domain-containing protein, partial [Glomus cerebriforme]